VYQTQTIHIYSPSFVLVPNPMPKLADFDCALGVQILFRYSGIDVPNDFSSSHSAFYRLAATDVAMPEDFRGFTTFYDCPAEDDGAAKCARHCSENLKDDLVSFSVTGHIAVCKLAFIEHRVHSFN